MPERGQAAAAAAGRPVVDQDVRDRVTTDLSTTFLLEAGAGTGKTRVLVDRYVRCVLDPERGTGDVGLVAAITFTEKAAGELRQRIREELELQARQAVAGSGRAALIDRALDGLDDAPITTIHGFSGRLLRELPVEAGIDPAFEQLDGLAAEIERGRLWDEWLGGLAADDAADRPERGHLERLLRAGVRLDHIRQLAAGQRGAFGERYDTEPAEVPPEPRLHVALDSLRPPADALRQLCADACSDQSDKGFAAAMALVEEVQSLLEDPPDEQDRLAALLYGLPLKGSVTALGGRAACWDAGCGGKEELQRRYMALADTVADLCDLYAGYIVGLALAVADSFARWAGETQIGLGRLDFTDLLGRLRDLLATDRAARGTLQRRFRYLLVDEFQDTDPLQAQIVAYLCERTPATDDWRHVVLEPGKLFVVGDPKQSIYRFRRADIALYDRVRKLVIGQPAGTSAVEVIGQNFRTTPAIVEWVNGVFAGVFNSDAAEGRQPRYQPVHAFRPPAREAAVSILLGREYGGRQSGQNEAARRAEARAVAGLLQEMHDPGAVRWHVQDRDGSAAADGEAGRPVRWGDIALLFRTTTGLETYEQALRQAAVPFRVDGGATYFQRREVADALLCLRAVDDPADGPAVYGALHSTLFGFSDDDLFLFWCAGGRFDLFADEQPSDHESVAAALRLLRELHERRGGLQPHELAAELLRVTCAAELAATTGSAAPQAMANLEKLVERARAFAGVGGGGLAAFLAWAADAGDAAGEQESPVDDDGDAVRLMTIHKAKGLEFPVVVLVGGALPSGGGGGRESVRPIVDRAGRRLSVKLKVELPGAAALDVEPRAYTALKDMEAKMEASELRRLLYVAATRARDHLVISCFGKPANKDGSAAAGALLGPIKDHLPAPGPEPPAADYPDGGLLVLAPGEPPASAPSGPPPDVAALLRERRTWREERAALLARAGTPAALTSPSGLEHVDEEARLEGAGAPAGRATALLLGTLVHEVMERCDLHDETSVARTAAAVAAGAGRPDLADRVTELATACWRAPCVRAAAASSVVRRELPVGVMVGDAVVTGSVDLLYLDGQEWVVADYKTDRDADEAVLRERYAPQGAAYALAVEKATGRRVARIVLVGAAADGREVSIAVDDELRASVAGEVERAVAESRPIRPDELAAAGL